MKQYKFDRNYLNLLIKNKDKLLDNDLIILVTYIEVLQDKIEVYENMRKEANEKIIIKQARIINEKDYKITDLDLDELLNILNKVGEDNECIYNK